MACPPSPVSSATKSCTVGMCEAQCDGVKGECAILPACDSQTLATAATETTVATPIATGVDVSETLVPMSPAGTTTGTTTTTNGTITATSGNATNSTGEPEQSTADTSSFASTASSNADDNSTFSSLSSTSMAVPVDAIPIVESAGLKSWQIGAIVGGAIGFVLLVLIVLGVVAIARRARRSAGSTAADDDLEAEQRASQSSATASAGVYGVASPQNPYDTPQLAHGYDVVQPSDEYNAAPAGFPAGTAVYGAAPSVVND